MRHREIWFALSPPGSESPATLNARAALCEEFSGDPTRRPRGGPSRPARSASARPSRHRPRKDNEARARRLPGGGCLGTYISL